MNAKTKLSAWFLRNKWAIYTLSIIYGGSFSLALLFMMLNNNEWIRGIGFLTTGFFLTLTFILEFYNIFEKSFKENVAEKP